MLLNTHDTGAALRLVETVAALSVHIVILNHVLAHVDVVRVTLISMNGHRLIFSSPRRRSFRSKLGCIIVVIDHILFLLDGITVSVRIATGIVPSGPIAHRPINSTSL